ncbi:hypothetical protein MMC25_006631 [Agyrium rufum]|nr:hypothetical protein [Agyrium rufum]
MESGRVANFTSLAEGAPLFAQGFTAAHWGLQPFPGNLVATTGSASAINSTSRLVYSLPYDLSSVPSDFYNQYNWTVTTCYDYFIVISSPDGQKYNVLRDINSTTQQCSHQNTSSSSDCIILIDRVGRSAFGPLNTNIAALAHGLTVIVVVLLTAVAAQLILRRGFLGKGLDDEDLNRSYQRPRSWYRGYKKQVAVVQWVPEPMVEQVELELPQYPTGDDLVDQIHHAETLIRQLAGLRTAFDAMGNAIPEEKHHRETMRQQANSLLDEVRRIVRRWPELLKRSTADWTDENARVAEEIRHIVFNELPQRY